MQQLRSDIWCAAFVRRHNDMGKFCVVSRRGDAIAGQIWIEVDHLDGTISLFTPAPGAMMDLPPEDRVFQKRFERADPITVKDRIAREIEFDQDLWVLSVDSRGDDLGLDMV
ncbi:DUF1491 family protein [Pelagibacterium halotolerans]|uniref:DUF1491 family protein n=1 Tax=Pelagibacterium halotolerans (strain DSM 22347 / JCM 15775 / CGMCC 1.7692 / B2) TaxID=1082931 RepID=G4RCJ9_PELHB|nr:DUF1491 family protein [Pelagibacterium halotolerans]AEQ50671.1 hypothetical protein KKY_632 [Pelagibacterium halotolerans B2]QJR19395.1 DUF1491 family protein [Pelagibacterium halotolerans]SDZ92645.1 hypothetical protein SAMN05428936_101562 [Pelagibacterium halotolerans]